MNLTPTERTIYAALKLSRGEILSYGELMATATGGLPLGTEHEAKLLRVHISNLRRKLPESEAARIIAARGQGYYYAPLRRFEAVTA